MSNPVQIQIVATGAAQAAEETRRPAEALQKVEQTALGAARAAEQAGRALREVGSSRDVGRSAAAGLRLATTEANRLTSALERARAAERSMMASFRPALAIPEGDRALSAMRDRRQQTALERAGLNAAGMAQYEPEPMPGAMSWDAAVARWTASVRAADGASAGLRQSSAGASAGMAGLSRAAGGSADRMQSLAGAALALSGSTGPAASGVRMLAGAMLVANGSAGQFMATLRGGAAMAAASWGIDRLVGKFADLKTAADEANQALAEIGSLEAGSVTRWDIISEHWGMPSRQSTEYGSDWNEENSRRARQEKLKRDAARWDEEARPKTAEERAREKMLTEPDRDWTRKDYQSLVEGYELSDAEFGGDRSRAEIEKEYQAARRELMDRRHRARITGIADPMADALYATPRDVFESAGAGDPAEGMRLIEERWKAQQDAAKEYAADREKLTDEIAAAETRLAQARTDAADDAARREIAAERERLQQRLAAMAESARLQRSAADALALQEVEARRRLLQTPDTAAERRDRRRTERQERSFERGIASARRREAELVAGGADPAEARRRLTRRGRELLEYDDLRTQAHTAAETARTADEQQREAKAETENALAVLRERELALGREQVDATAALTAELGRLRQQLADLPQAPGAQKAGGAAGEAQTPSQATPPVEPAAVSPAEVPVTVAPTPGVEAPIVSPAEVPVETAPTPPAAPAAVAPAEVPVETAPTPPAEPAAVTPAVVPVTVAPTPPAEPAAVTPAEVATPLDVAATHPVPVGVTPAVPPAGMPSMAPEPATPDIARRLASARRRLAELMDAGLGRDEAVDRLTRRGQDLVRTYGQGPSAAQTAAKAGSRSSRPIDQHLQSHRIGDRLQRHRIGPRLADGRLKRFADEPQMPDRTAGAGRDRARGPSWRPPAMPAAAGLDGAPDLSPMLGELRRHTDLLGQLTRMTGVT